MGLGDFEQKESFLDKKTKESIIAGRVELSRLNASINAGRVELGRLNTNLVKLTDTLASSLKLIATILKQRKNV